MVAFVELVQQTFRKFQLQFEIALIDRDITNRQRKFGIELYDLIEHQRQQVTADLNNEKVFFQTIENGIRGPLDTARQELHDMAQSTPPFPALFLQRRKEEFGLEVYPIIVQKTQLVHEQVEADLLRKDPQTVGAFAKTAMTGLLKGTTQTLTAAVGKLSPEERKVDACVQDAKHDLQIFEEQKHLKVQAIQRLVESGTTLECGLTDCGAVGAVTENIAACAPTTGNNSTASTGVPAAVTTNTTTTNTAQVY